MTSANILNVLIVDDELPIRQELRMFDWKSCNAVLVGEAENGLEALNFCREYAPDVIITDIIMPVMDGLTLLQELKKEFPHIQVVILTYHSDFDYARQALKQGALGYIVKVMFEDDELRQVLEKARENIQRELSHRRSEQEKNRWEQSKLFGQIMMAPPAMTESYLNKLASIGLNITFPRRMVRLCVNSRPQDWIFVDREIQNYLSETDRLITWVPVGVGEYLIFFDKGQDNHVILSQKVDKIITDLNSILSFISGEVRIYSIISGTIRKADEYVDIFKKTELLKSFSFYDSESKVFIGEQISLASISGQELSKILEKVRKLNFNTSELLKFIREDFYEWALEQKVVPDELKNLAIQLMSEWSRQEANNSIELEYTSRILESSTFDQMIATMVYALERQSSHEIKYHPQVRLAMKKIVEKLKEPISLSSIAEDVGLSPHYLSRLFAEEVGESFNEFVTRKRMEKAMELLKTSNLKVYEVAEQVGIPSYRYFSVVFRNWAGVAPKEYKKL